ncbi:hypothetical protein [Microbacterium sp. EST19A]|uniref:hypothetical protein n=1 Tax=Microbacterium sp. EST19A TaxID=2862681 RepID=UPI001CBAB272|nr:hypothetical protein [Microbacterium sp. EST19A]
MTTWRVASDLASVMVPIGIVGAVLAAICAIVAAVAIVRGAEGLSGGAVAVWIVGALTSFTASFANQWMPLIVACSALVAMLVIGGVVRLIVGATADGREARRQAREREPVPSVVKPAPAMQSASTGAIAVVS